MINLSVKVKEATAYLSRLVVALLPDRIDRVVDRVALQTHRKVFQETPKKWFGQVRRSWQIERPEIGSRLIVNEDKVMLFLEEGTANQGTGWIRPQSHTTGFTHTGATSRRPAALYIPLTRKAAKDGWNSGLKYGRDYILRAKVRGIKPRRIAARVAVWAQEKLNEAMKAHIARAIRS